MKVPKKIKNTITKWPTKSTSGYLLKRTEIRFLVEAPSGDSEEAGEEVGLEGEFGEWCSDYVAPTLYLLVPCDPERKTCHNCISHKVYLRTSFGLRGNHRWGKKESKILWPSPPSPLVILSNLKFNFHSFHENPLIQILAPLWKLTF